MTLDLINDLFLPSFIWCAVAVTVLVLIRRSRNTPAAALHLYAFVTLAGGVFILSGVRLLPPLEWAIVPQVMNGWLQYSLFTGPAFAWLDLMVLVYLAVMLWKLSCLYHEVFQAYGLLSACEDVKEPMHVETLQTLKRKLAVHRKVNLHYTREVTSPMTFGWSRPRIILPVSSVYWSDEMVADFLSHELIHIRRADWVALVSAKMMCAVLWFLPPVHALLQRIRWYSELATDDLVVATSGERLRYARNLLHMSRAVQPSFTTVGLIDGSTVYQRIAANLDSARVRNAPSVIHYAYLLVIVMSIVVGASFNFVEVRAEAQPMIRSTALNIQVPNPQQAVTRSMPTVQPGVELLPPDEVVLFPEPQVHEITDFSVSTIDPEEEVLVDVAEAVHPSDVTMKASPNMNLLIRKRTVPEYPRSALRKAEQGWVTLVFSVSSRGRVEKIEVARSSGVEALDRAAIQAVRAYQYFPLKDATGITGISETFHFQLGGP